MSENEANHPSVDGVIDEATAVVDDATDQAESAVRAARERFRDAATNAKSRASEISQDLRRGASKAGEVAKERYGVISERARGGYDQARKDLDDLGENVNEYVRDNPSKAVLLAAGVGFVVGLLIRGSGDRS
ncbi:MAG: hypothetical protein AAGD01_16950 [Acidobacteriota bacterium]